MIDVRKTICPYDCPSSCGLLVETDGKRILKVKGDPDHPAAHGLICTKMQHYERSIHSPQRILTPLKRVGKKGEGKFVSVSWEEAVSEIARRWKTIIEKDGADAILPVYYSGVMSVIQRKCGDAFFNRMGAAQMVLTLCSSAKGAAYESVFGETGCLDPRELKDSDFLLIWGSNVKATRIHTMPVIRQARNAGKRVVLIEACACDMAQYCDETILVRPGSDGALALAMMHVLEREHLSDEAFLKEKTEGYETFRETLKQYTPQWAEKITGAAAETIEHLAREYAAAQAPAILYGSGPSRHGNGGMNSRLVMILSMFTGAWGKPGGGYCGNNPGAGPYVDSKRVTHPEFRTQKGRVVNINQLGAALADTTSAHPVKSVYVYGSNPVNSVSDQTAILRGLTREDIFTVVHERFMTDTARFADIILPAAFSVEQNDCYTAYGYCTFGTAKKILEPAGQCKSNWDTFCLLAKAMGYGEDHFKKSEEEMLKELLDHPKSGLASASEEDWKLLRSGGVITTPFADHGQFRTENGKARIVDENQPEPVPCYMENYGGSESLRLVAVPDFYGLNSIHLDRGDLAERRGPAALILNPQDAKVRGIASGDKVIAWNDLAEVEFVAYVTELAAPGTATAPGVYGSAQTGRLLQVNALHHGRLSDIGAATTINDNTIEVRLKSEAGDSLKRPETDNKRQQKAESSFIELKRRV